MPMPPPTSSTYSISELAKEFDVTTRTIRFYEEKGMITPSRKGNVRLYTSADRTTLKLILRGKRLGLTLEESGDIIGMYTPGRNNADQLETLIAKIRDKKSQLEQQQQDLALMLIDLQDAEEKCLDALASSEANL
jgi:DNA-binding transcriptional MerR regulator